MATTIRLHASIGYATSDDDHQGRGGAIRQPGAPRRARRRAPELRRVLLEPTLNENWWPPAHTASREGTPKPRN